MQYFYPRPPRGGRLKDSTIYLETYNFYPRPPRGGRRECLNLGQGVLYISIHALREEGDVAGGQLLCSATKFLSTPSARRATFFLAFLCTSIIISIHALREEGDPFASPRRSPVYSFLSTPSARRATSYAIFRVYLHLYFYPRPPRGGRRAGDFRVRAGADISIHALREEGDCPADDTAVAVDYFYPRPPRGGRPLDTIIHSHPPYFYPRPPRGGRPFAPGIGRKELGISIHALREEGDSP